jgi:steroid delta-isomerase-like uncharacterized protein
MSNESNKAAVRRWIDEGWNRGGLEVADELFGSDFVAAAMDTASGELHGVDDLKGYVRVVRSALPDIRFTVEHLVAEGDKVVGVFNVQGTHRGALWGIPPSGREVSFMAIDVWRFRDGKIVERCAAVADFLRALQQMGVVPTLGR